MQERTLPEIRKSRWPYIDRSREMAWIAEPQSEYAGPWVGLDGGRLIGYGDNPVPIVEQARGKGIERPLGVHLKKEQGPSIPCGDTKPRAVCISVYGTPYG
ncbi:MAG: hypothetical protein HY231_21620 [Acidobacteria bacterium]|nr:hypothetical protein [Acidobacteriota bacterium]